MPEITDVQYRTMEFNRVRDRATFAAMDIGAQRVLAEAGLTRGYPDRTFIEVVVGERRIAVISHLEERGAFGYATHVLCFNDERFLSECSYVESTFAGMTLIGAASHAHDRTRA